MELNLIQLKVKLKTNISALLLAALVFVASNGVAVFEHICNISQTHSYSLFVKPACEMEKSAASCCAKLKSTKKDCCNHKQFFSKLSVEGFTVKQLQLKQIEKQTHPESRITFASNNNKQIFENHYSGLQQPDNVFTIKSILQPSSISLQVFRC